MVNKIKIGWLLIGFVALAIGVWAYYTGTVFVYERVKGTYSVTEIENRARYWTYTMMYFHGFVFCLFVSLKGYYTKRLKELMSFNDKSSLNIHQVVFILLVAGVLFGSNFYISQAIANA